MATPLTITWTRLVDAAGTTCDRCTATGRALDEALGTLRPALAPLGLEPRIETETLDYAAFAVDPSRSNAIVIAGRPLEAWLGAEVASSPCCPLCGGADCRTLELDGERYEAVPAGLIVRAVLRAAAAAVAPGTPATAGPCAPGCCG